MVLLGPCTTYVIGNLVGFDVSILIERRDREIYRDSEGVREREKGRTSEATNRDSERGREREREREGGGRERRWDRESWHIHFCNM